MGDTVLVTGSCGFLGPYLIEELVDNGYEVRATDLPGADYSIVRGLECEIVPADLLEPSEAARVFKGSDMVLHTAARMAYDLTRDEYMKANYRVTVNACEAAAASGVKRFVHFSTCDTYGPPKYTPVDEDHPQNPLNLYAATKLFGEQAAFRYHRRHGLPLTVIRPTTIYGPRMVYVAGLFVVLPVILKNLGINLVHLPRKGFLGNLVHARDIAGASVFAMEKEDAVGEAYNLSDDSTMPAGQLMGVILNSVGIEARTVLPTSNRLVSLAARLGSFLPRAFFTLVTNVLQKAWDGVVVDHRLIPALRPRFDPGFMSFGRGDYDFDNSKIKGLGYELREPDFKKGWYETVRWFMDQEWIPAYQQI